MTLRIAPSNSRLSGFRLADPQPAVRQRRRLRTTLRPARLPFPDAAPAHKGKRLQEERQQLPEGLTAGQTALPERPQQVSAAQQVGQPQRAAGLPVTAPRTDLPDPQRALARVRVLRGQRVLLERDLASALGTLPGRLADLALRHPEWFPVQARFALSPQECEQQGLWFTRPDLAPAGFATRWKDYPPAAPVAYTADGLVAAAHWLEAEAVRAGDPYAETTDLASRFRLAWQALQP